MLHQNQTIQDCDAQHERHSIDRGIRSASILAALTGLSVSISLLVVLCIFTEFSSMLMLPDLRWFLTERPAEGNSHLSFYKNKPWAEGYWKEVNASNKFQFQPYVFWRRRAFVGQYVNIDANGIRRTANSDCTPQATRIWMFGGSSLWGTGAKDDETIPSILAKIYSESTGPVCITNFGEAGWVSTQEVIQLEIALKHTHNAPNLVLFYDGFGDIFAPYETGLEDLPVGFDQLRQKVEDNKQDSALAYLKEINTYKVIGLLMDEVLKLKNTREQSGYLAIPPAKLDLYAHMAADNYLENIRLVESLSIQYRFRYATFWGPLLFLGHKPLGPEERKAKRSLERAHPGISQLCQKAYDLIFSAQPKYVKSLADVFDGTTEDVFIDQAHTNPLGNRVIARRIEDIIKRSDIGQE